MHGYVHELQAARRRNKYGKKAENLQFLAEKGYRVPTTHLLPFEVRDIFAKDEQGTLARMEEDLKSAIRSDRSYAVRSSANVEDADKHSFAGQFKTVLEVSGAKGVAEAVIEVWRSVSPGATTDYMRLSSRDLSEIRMGVIVQEMVPQMVSGVSFSVNPLTGAQEVVVEAVKGSGEALVQQGVTPQRWVWSGTDWSSKPSYEDIQNSLIDAVVSATKRIASDYGAPVDLEWVFDGQELYFVQLRDITTKGALTVYSNLFSREVLPGLIKPLVWSVNVPLVNGAWARFLSEMTGVKGLDPRTMAKQFYYRAYFNMTAIGMVWKRMGMPEDSLERLLGVSGSGAGFKVSPNAKMLGVAPHLLNFLRRHILLSAELERFIPAKRDQLDAFAREGLGALSEEELVARVDRLTDALTETAYYMVLAPMASNLFNRMLETRLKKAGIDPASFDALGGLEEIREYYPNEMLGQLHAGWQSLPEEKQRQLRTEGVIALRSWPEGEVFRTGYDRLMRDFGHISESGSDFSRRPWREDPDFVLTLIVNYPDAVHQGSARAGIDEIQVSARQRSSIRIAYGKARKFSLLKERMSITYSFGYGLYRNYFLELGKRFQLKQVLVDQEDIFYLSLDEVRQIVAGGCAGNTCNNYRLRAAMRKREMSMYQDVEVPTLIYGEKAPALKDTGQGELRGTPSSGGYYRGRARVIRSASEFDRLQQGEVLVIPYSDVGWTPMFSKAGAVIAESGGMLSHTSIIAREYGIPAVVSVEGATVRIKDGSEVSVDGYNGSIVLEQ